MSTTKSQQQSIMVTSDTYDAEDIIRHMARLRDIDRGRVWRVTPKGRAYATYANGYINQLETKNDQLVSVLDNLTCEYNWSDTENCDPHALATDMCQVCAAKTEAGLM